MSSYTPEFYYGHIPGTYGEYGLVPWPAHMTTPRNAEPLPDIDLPALFNEVTAQANMPGVVVLSLNPKDRVELATTIERLINLLDAVDGDCDLETSADDEPSLGWTTTGGGASVSTHKLDLDLERDDADLENSLGWGQGTQAYLAASDEREEENEHGGDVQDEPHDLEPDNEYSLGWPERCGQWADMQALGLNHMEQVDGEDATLGGSYTRFDGSGTIAARNALRKTLGKAPRPLPPLPIGYGENAVRLSDGSIFRTFPVPIGSIPNIARNRCEPDRLFPVAPGIMRVGF